MLFLELWAKMLTAFTSCLKLQYLLNKVLDEADFCMQMYQSFLQVDTSFMVGVVMYTQIAS